MLLSMRDGGQRRREDLIEIARRVFALRQRRD
jgi:hypothetical protein